MRPSGPGDRIAHSLAVAVQNVLRASLLPQPLSASSSSSSSPAPPLDVLTAQHGALFGRYVSEQWASGGGREVHEAVAGIQGGAAGMAGEEDAEAEEDDEGDAEGDEDEDEGEGERSMEE